ncbi:TylF/MycF/NovP-related O-methyltransferase [Streptomyces sp. SCSIO 30461]|uniref:TylF/MycF/NovP-related O-methyltransferase n=1 Tax=Streptomyces sp. SCSIO 30461 TaxID=3118085 RepID=UPI0030CAC0CC
MSSSELYRKMALIRPDWRDDPDFTSFLQRFRLTGEELPPGATSSEASIVRKSKRWMVSQLIRLTEGINGDTAECGVWEGSTSWIICSFLAHRSDLNKRHHLFDSFEGISEPGSFDGECWREGDFQASQEVVADNLSAYRGICRFHRGWIPDRFPDVASLTFSFVHLDVDLYEPTKASLEFFYDRLNPGGVLVCDDYGANLTPGATKAMDEFLDGRPESVVACDASGGFLIKGVMVGPKPPLGLDPPSDSRSFSVEMK